MGDYLKKGDNVAKIVDLDPILIKINVTENDIKNLKLKQKTEVIISDKSYEGSVSYISKTSDPLTRNFKVEVQIDNQKKYYKWLVI